MEVLREDKCVKYELLNTSAIDDVAIAIAGVFSQSEPMAVAQGVSQEEIANLIKPLGFKVAQESLTIVAKSEEADELIGVLLCDDFAAATVKDVPVPSKKLAPILAILDELDSQYKQGKSLSLNEYLHLSLLAVKPQHRGKKIAQNLVQVSLENGIRKKYQKTVTTATGAISQHIFRQFGFVERIKIPYRTFRYQDEQVFTSLEGSIILMDKSLT